MMAQIAAKLLTIRPYQKSRRVFTIIYTPSFSKFAKLGTYTQYPSPTMLRNRLISKYFLTLIFIGGLALSSHASNTPLSIKNADQKISLRFELGINDRQRTRLYQWVEHTSAALKTVYGEWPMDHFVTRFEASRYDRGPVPWGEVSRKSPPEVKLVVDINATLDELKEDWTIYHEFSHLLIPYDGGGSRWFSEGLASYYQNILQARSGMFDERRMWQKLYDGFERGRKQTNLKHQDLATISDGMRKSRNFMRIYWSGALYWLEADVALRQHDSKMSVDKALAELRRCCVNHSLSAQQLSNRLDALTQTTIFSDLFKKYARSHAIPDYQALLKSLGISQRFGNVRLNNDANLSKLRHSIYQGEH
ncbi:MAG: hypothetical protein ACI93R_001071 [Flavobacteriales bacterium]|jgi:hypothetical protein